MKIILVTMIFVFGGGQITMTTEVETIIECKEIIQAITTNVGKENMLVATCEKI